MALKKKSASSKAVKKNVISERDIRNRAQEIYEKRIKEGTQGDALSDWLQAEKELGYKR